MDSDKTSNTWISCPRAIQLTNILLSLREKKEQISQPLNKVLQPVYSCHQSRFATHDRRVMRHDANQSCWLRPSYCRLLKAKPMRPNAGWYPSKRLTGSPFIFTRVYKNIHIKGTNVQCRCKRPFSIGLRRLRVQSESPIWTQVSS